MIITFATSGIIILFIAMHFVLMLRNALESHVKAVSKVNKPIAYDASFSFIAFFHILYNTLGYIFEEK